VSILGTGIDYSTGARLFAPIDEARFGDALARWLQATGLPAEQSKTLRQTRRVKRKVEEVGRPRTVDLANAREAGWTFIVRRDGKHRDAIVDAIRPLAEHRGMAEPRQPLEYEPNMTAAQWLQERYFARTLGGGTPSAYVLVVGTPDEIPFRFQSVVDSAAMVGRLDFDRIDDLREYAEKVVRLETAEDPAPAHDFVCFAPDYGPDDPTHYSCRFLARPLADRMGVKPIEAEDATKDALLAACRDTKPAIVFTASHGMAAPSESLEVQKRVTGGICCDRTPGAMRDRWLLTADDIPATDPFLEGAVFFQFACFGYGTPQESDFSHWMPDSFGVPQRIAKADFVSAIPKRLLANPRGALAFIGHVDTAWMHGFADPNDQRPIEQWHDRAAPFAEAIDTLLRVQPPGLALTAMNKRYDITNAELTGIYDDLQAQRVTMDPELEARLSDAFILRGDAQNYMVFGDPAVCPRMPAARANP
jgi:hypothetical protein